MHEDLVNYFWRSAYALCTMIEDSVVFGKTKRAVHFKIRGRTFRLTVSEVKDDKDKVP